MDVIKHGSNHSGRQLSTEIKQERKRRLENLFYSDVDTSEYKKLQNGEYCCLICRQKPVFSDTHGLLSHRNGKKHKAEEIRYRKCIAERAEKKYRKSNDTQNEIKSPQRPLSLLESTTNITNQILHGNNIDDKEKKPQLNSSNQYISISSLHSQSTYNHNTKHNSTALQGPAYLKNPIHNDKLEISASIPLSNMVEQPIYSPSLHIPSKIDRERELELIQKGYKKDIYGGWYRDEEVEFDDDDEVYIPPAVNQ
ncbi:hypothetical protein WA158_007980 [Blastocystis sp. Blastoise]